MTDGRVDERAPLSVRENEEPGARGASPLGYLFVRDADSGRNGATACAPANDSLFALRRIRSSSSSSSASSSTSGGGTSEYSIHLLRAVDREAQPRLALELICTDGGAPLLSCAHSPLFTFTFTFSFSSLLAARMISD